MAGPSTSNIITIILFIYLFTFYPSWYVAQHKLPFPYLTAYTFSLTGMHIYIFPSLFFVTLVMDYQATLCFHAHVSFWFYSLP